MRLSDVRWRSHGGERELVARVCFERAEPGEYPVWFRAPLAGDRPAAPGDPLLAGFLVPSLFLGERLVIDAPVSAPALRTAREHVAPLMQRWYSEAGAARVEPAAVVPAPAPSGGRQVGCFFSGGVDSWYSLLRRGGEITALIHLHGMEIDTGSRALSRLAVEHVRRIARERGLGVLGVATNLREVAVGQTRRRLRRLGISHAGFGLDRCLGHLLVAPALFLRDRFERLLVSASWPADRAAPHGSHPLVEPSWSAPDLAIELVGGDAGRVGKLRALREGLPDALHGLRVCVDQQSQHLNCGHCYKCLRTLLELRAAGVAEPPACFPEVPSQREILRMRPAVDDYYFPDLLDEARRAGDHELVRTVEVLMGRRLHGPRAWDSLRFALPGSGPQGRRSWSRRLRRLVDRPEASRARAREGPSTSKT